MPHAHANGNEHADGYSNCNTYHHRNTSYSVAYPYGNSDANGWAAGYSHSAASS
jgi:hypothetical protein